ncbi:NADP(H)-dependent aldo-keto reductase [Beggiatoa leptomitoformis]|uniref:Protein tas n=1 Tax=Beggiatoa leptomitoformis TaxID=288004 RepID=A0A2N9YIL1_9GAMM|nr:NADP(H)-dependent aldo-keto reductase [Beggiatoa leptomitoformis]ALG67436.1 NADP(H)-dependent aldo-keto reductase [Beggiatoa leptomitoformis]AUI70347.1 NADP(H)-dependent aldo-keto reductase [Beggiatoa leptomitoformis]
MKYNALGYTDIQVSRLCLGTMTWGEQNTEEEAHEQLDYALAQGINFIDTAELYPVPPRAETQGLTETYLGTWLHKRQNRDKVILATKIAGPGDWVQYIRQGPRLTRTHINQAVEDSLKRLQTDYIDLYQVHWPDRNTNFFGKLGYTHQENEQYTAIEETLSALAGLVQAGKIRYIGISNETPWGVMTYLRLAEQQGYPRLVSIQNPYNLLNRSFEVGLAEIAHREQVGLLAYSPMAFGMLSGKYLNNAHPIGARVTLFERFSRYKNDNGVKATQAYVQLAKKFDIDPAQMALAYVNSRPFLTATLIGATSLEQLRSNIQSIDLMLSAEVLEGIETIHKEHPNPCP